MPVQRLGGGQVRPALRAPHGRRARTRAPPVAHAAGVRALPELTDPVGRRRGQGRPVDWARGRHGYDLVLHGHRVGAVARVRAGRVPRYERGGHDRGHPRAGEALDRSNVLRPA